MFEPAPIDDGVVVAADHGLEPDRSLVFEYHAADERRVGRHEVVLATQFDAMFAQRVEHRTVSTRRQEPDVPVPRLRGALGIVGVGEHADVGEHPGFLAERAAEILEHVARKFCHFPTPAAPDDATTICTRFVRGLGMIVPTGTLFDQM